MDLGLWTLYLDRVRYIFGSKIRSHSSLAYILIRKLIDISENRGATAYRVQVSVYFTPREMEITTRKQLQVQMILLVYACVRLAVINQSKIEPRKMV